MEVEPEKRDYQAVLAEYTQTWEDFRHRTNIEMTILSVFFATFAGLVFAYSQTAAPGVRVAMALGGILLSIGVASLFLGERRAWAADLARLHELEPLLSGEGGKLHLVRIRHYDRLWTHYGYSLGWVGSFAWYLALVVVVSGVFGGLLGAVVAEQSSLAPTFIWLLTGLLAGALVALFISEMMRKTLEASMRNVRETHQNRPQ